MPIKDLQKKKPGLARAGIIRLGYKVKKCKGCETVNPAGNKTCDKCGKSEWPKRKYSYDEWIESTYPIPSDHFVLTDAPGVAQAISTDKPTELRVYLPFNEIENNFPAYHQYWVASALVCRGDGEHIQYAINPQSGDVIIRDGQAVKDFKSGDGEFLTGDIMSCPGMAHDTYKKCEHCKPNAMLIVLLRDVPRLAYYQIATTSIHNIVNLTEQLTYIQQTIGRLQGVPFILKLRPRKISVPKGNGNGRMRTEKHLLSLEVDPEWVQQLFRTQNRLASPERQLLTEATPTGDDVIEMEEVEELPHPPPQSSGYSHVEPPVWMPPNGGDDSDESGDEPTPPDYQAEFAERVIKKIPWYQNNLHVQSTIEALEIGPVTEDTAEMVFDELAKNAQAAADTEAAQKG